MASDSQATEMLAGVRFDVQKVFSGGGIALWGASGLSTIIDDIKESLESNEGLLKASPRPDRAIASLVIPVVQKHYGAFVQVPGDMQRSPATDLIGCCLSADGSPCLFEVDRNCQAGVVSREWAAVGSGAGFAQFAGALMAHLGVSGKTIEYGKLVVYRAVRAVIEASSFGVGGAVQLWQLTQAGCGRVDEAELEALQERLAAWQEIEQDGLDSLFGDTVSPTPMPAPSIDL